MAPRNFGDWRRFGQAGPVVELLGVPRDGDGRLGQPPQALVVEAVARRDSDPPADRDPEVEALVRLGDVLVDLAIGEARQASLIGRDDRLDFVRAAGLRQGDRSDPGGERVEPRAHHLPTPT